MAKAQKLEVKAVKDPGEKVKEAKVKSPPPNGEQHRPFPWAEPFPASVPDKDGKETIYVRASLSQDVIINGHKRGIGEHTIPCDFAHSHANILSAPAVK